MMMYDETNHLGEAKDCIAAAETVADSKLLNEPPDPEIAMFTAAAIAHALIALVQHFEHGETE